MHTVSTIVLAAIIAFGGEPINLTGDALPEDRGAAGLHRALLQLRTTASVMHIVAHPDDEDAALLTWLSRKHGARVMLLSLTRGEGGANLISSDSFEALGALRTLETLEACRRYGAELFFTRAFDYGFSKSLDEARERWDADAILSDVVRVIRRERPDIIISRFRGTARDGHGQHAYAGVMARRAFEESARGGDLDGGEWGVLRPWQAAKLYLPASKDEKGLILAPVVLAPVGEYDPLLGRSYHQLAREGYSLHRSQGMAGAPASPGAREAVYRLERWGDAEKKLADDRSFFDGLDTSLRGIAHRWGPDPPADLVAGLEAMSIAVDHAFDAFNAVEPWQCAEPLVEALRACREVVGFVEATTRADEPKADTLRLLRRKEEELQRAIALALGIHFDALAELPAPSGEPDRGLGSRPALRHAVPGQTVEVRMRLVNPSPVEVEWRSWSGNLRQATGLGTGWGGAGMPPLLVRDAATGHRLELEIPDDAELSRHDYFLESLDTSLYTVDSPGLEVFAGPRHAVTAGVGLKVLGEDLRLSEPIRCGYLDPVRGYIRPPLAIVPRVSVAFDAPRGFLRAGVREHGVRVVVSSSANDVLEGTAAIRLPPGWACVPSEAAFRLERDGEDAVLEFRLTVPEGLSGGVHEIGAVARAGGVEYGEGFRTITARDLGRFDLYTAAVHRLTVAPVEVAPGLRVGYVMGAGDDVPRALERLGCKVEMLGEEELGGADLSGYDAVLIGIRAYAVRPDLRAHTFRLLEYVEGGGVLVVQYQTPEFDANFGPYPYSMTGNPEEVSEESASVTILDPSHPVFSAPNLITAADFEAWIEQRGSKFLKSWDERYTPLLECHDRNQEPQRGGLLYARHGKGIWIYNAYAGYRQLPFGVPGAYRLYANLVSLRRTLP